MEISPLGDSALIVRVCERLGDDPEQGLERVLRLLSRLEAAKIPGVIELTSAYTTVAVFYDPVRVIGTGAEMDSAPEWLAARISAAVTSDTGTSDRALEPRHLVIPVCYGGEYGPDLENVARRASLPQEEVVNRHSGAEYLVHCIGFSPGFAYLGGLPPELNTPRRAVPRISVPAGSVGIGGRQTGIYPVASPGGWHLIGRTPQRLFTLNANPPTALRAGDRVRFRAITANEFEAWRE
jgi:inhibitor of KinA